MVKDSQRVLRPDLHSSWWTSCIGWIPLDMCAESFCTATSYMLSRELSSLSILMTALSGLLSGELGFTWNRAGAEVGPGDTAEWDGVLDQTTVSEL